MLAHPLHPARELADGVGQRLLLKIAQHVMAIANRLDVVQRTVEERRQLIFLSAREQREQDLVEMQITEEGRLLSGRVDAVVAVKQDAVE